MLQDIGNDDICWLLERLLIAGLPVFDLNWVLFELIKLGYEQSVINILLMSEYPNIRKQRGLLVR